MFFQVVAVLLHYNLLTSIIWILFEAYSMYFEFVKVFYNRMPMIQLKACCIAWGEEFMFLSLF